MEKKYISPKRDYVFKKIFNNEKEGYLKDFLEALLKEEIIGLKVLQDTVLDKESEDNKSCILDVVAKIGDTYIHLEMQNKVTKDFENRVDLYDKKESGPTSRINKSNNKIYRK